MHTLWQAVDLSKTPLYFERSQPKARVELAAIMFAATGKTSDCAFDFSHAREIAAAVRTVVHKARRITLCRKWQGMTALLACDPQIPTRLLPLGAMRRDA